MITLVPYRFWWLAAETKAMVKLKQITAFVEWLEREQGG
jgi:hypothetical protein